jgi:hypothetical protein
VPLADKRAQRYVAVYGRKLAENALATQVTKNKPTDEEEQRR